MKIHYRVKNNTIEIIRCYGTDSRVVLPEEINGILVVSAAPYAFSAHKDDEEEAEVWESEDTVSFGEERLLAGEEVQEIVFPDALKEIGRYIFMGAKTGTAGIFGYADAGGNRGVYGLQRAEGACDPSEKGNQILCKGNPWGTVAEDRCGFSV